MCRRVTTLADFGIQIDEAPLLPMGHGPHDAGSMEYRRDMESMNTVDDARTSERGPAKHGGSVSRPVRWQGLGQASRVTEILRAVEGGATQRCGWRGISRHHHGSGQTYRKSWNFAGPKSRRARYLGADQTLESGGMSGLGLPHMNGFVLRGTESRTANPIGEIGRGRMRILRLRSW